MVINTNTTASAATRNLANSTSLLSKSLARLSSGSKITSPEDDAAGLAQSMKFEAQMNRNNAVRSNVGNAISFTQTQDGFLQKVQSSLDRMSELSVLSQDITKTNTDRSNYSVEFTQ
ncbi:MAG: flagellin, partial [Verrucomicrobia bacterium]|nr:flagellin [Verrucomicrobiota bacterium]